MTEPSADRYWFRLSTLLASVKFSEPNNATGSNTCDALTPSVAEP